MRAQESLLSTGHSRGKYLIKKIPQLSNFRAIAILHFSEFCKHGIPNLILDGSWDMRIGVEPMTVFIALNDRFYAKASMLFGRISQ